MGMEIERKFLVTSDAWRQEAKGVRYVQAYLSTAPGRTVRVRIAGEKAYLTVKGGAKGISRAEFEYSIPMVDAEEMITSICEQPPIDKYRYRIPFAGFTWEVDEFHGENEGLVVAEIELLTEDTPFDLPPWIGAEVSHDHRYANSSLIRLPYRLWTDMP
jgi:adenylate cyclase